VELIGAVDTSPQLSGRPLAEVLGQPTLKLKVADSLERAMGRRRGVVLLHATGSRLPQVMDQIQDALKLGVPVVSTEVEGMSELLGTGAGIVVPPDADELAREIVALIRAADRRAQMGRTGRERIATEFSVERMVAAYRGLYRELASGGR
jgi:glycosyltransferase involved in cell wall biosynthesis